MKKIYTVLTILTLSFLIACQTSTSDHTLKISYVLDNEVMYTEEVKANTYFLPTYKATKEGYVFNGWYLDSEYLYPMAFNAGASNDLTLYAKWVINDTEEEPLDLEAWLLDNKDFINTLIDKEEEENLSAREIIELVNQAQEALIKDVNQSVVKIDIVSGANKDSGGSGVIYKKVGNVYYVLTNEHVTEGSSSSTFEITVFTGESTKTYKNITKVHETKTKDLAILKFETTDNLKVIEFETGENILKGQMVYALGSPVWFDDVVTQGIVSVSKVNDYDDYEFDADVIMHSAAINPGNSGGALINIYGKLVGINAYSYPMYDEETDLQLYNFAIHIDEVNQYIVGKN